MRVYVEPGSASGNNPNVYIGPPRGPEVRLFGTYFEIATCESSGPTDG